MGVRYDSTIPTAESDFDLIFSALGEASVRYLVVGGVAVDLAYDRRTSAVIGANSISVASIPDLIDLKTKAGRPKDLEDIRALEAILAHQGDRV